MLLNWTQTADGNNIQFYLFGANQWVIFQLTYTTPCGTVTKQFKWQSSNCGIGSGGCNAFAVSPNPTNGQVKVIVPNVIQPCLSLKTTNAPTNTDLNIAAINVYNLTGTIVRQVKVNGVKQSAIDLLGLINGSYYIETISTSGYKEKQLIILQK